MIEGRTTHPFHRNGEMSRFCLQKLHISATEYQLFKFCRAALLKVRLPLLCHQAWFRKLALWLDNRRHGEQQQWPPPGYGTRAVCRFRTLTPLVPYPGGDHCCCSPWRRLCNQRASLRNQVWWQSSSRWTSRRAALRNLKSWSSVAEMRNFWRQKRDISPFRWKGCVVRPSIVALAENRGE